MLQKEFEDKTGVNVSSDEYSSIDTKMKKKLTIRTKSSNIAVDLKFELLRYLDIDKRIELTLHDAEWIYDGRWRCEGTWMFDVEADSNKINEVAAALRKMRNFKEGKFSITVE